MRVNLPQRKEKNSRNLRRERRRWDDEESFSLALDCCNCADLAICGGQNKRQDGMSCLDDCCGNPEDCQSMCPNSPNLFTDMFREIDGFEFETVQRTAPCSTNLLPAYAPLIYHRSNRPHPLKVKIAALPLHMLYHKRDGRLRFTNRLELRHAFSLAEDAKVLLVGSGRDRPIEAWWGLSEARRNVLNALRLLDIELITSPNYSLFTDVPRYDNLRNTKRIVVTWQEILATGLPAGLHANARTVRDYNRLIEFVRARDEVLDIAFEFRTGAAWPMRRSFHASHLARLARAVGKPLNLVMVGGLPLITKLAPAFDRLLYIDTTAFMATTYRQRLFEGNDGKILKVPSRTAPGEAISELLDENVRTMRQHVERRISESRKIG